METGQGVKNAMHRDFIRQQEQQPKKCMDQKRCAMLVRNIKKMEW